MTDKYVAEEPSMKLLTLQSTLSLSLIMASSVAVASITEIHSMVEVPAHVTKDTLVVFDIDNTLLEASQTLGTDQWFSSVVEDKKAEGLDAKAAEKAAIAIAESVHDVIKARSVESVTAKMVYDLQARGVVVMGLTARSLPMIPGSLRQLQSNGINLGKNPIHKNTFDLQSTDVARFQNGILFVGPLNNKGELLKIALKRLGLRPKKVVFVDDKVKHVTNVDKFMNEMGIDVETLRYGAADARVQQFDVNLGRRELSVYQKDGIVLSDEEARGGFTGKCP